MLIQHDNLIILVLLVVTIAYFVFGSEIDTNNTFPIVIDRETQVANDTNYAVQEDGMDLRDYFAAKAMQGIVDSSVDSGLETIQIAESAYLIADAMMEVREN